MDESPAFSGGLREISEKQKENESETKMMKNIFLININLPKKQSADYTELKGLNESYAMKSEFLTESTEYLGEKSF